MTVVTDTVSTVALPTNGRALPPVTARKLGQLTLTYASFWMLGALPGFLGLGDAWVAAGLGLALPGGGFLYGGHPVWALVAVGRRGAGHLRLVGARPHPASSVGLDRVSRRKRITGRPGRRLGAPGRLVGDSRDRRGHLRRPPRRDTPRKSVVEPS